jgi:tape measure domain-containing protein
MSGVEIRVRANARQAQNELKGLGASIGRLEANANKLTKSFQNLALGITAVFTGGKLTQCCTRNGDAMTDMANKVNLVTKNAGQTSVVMNRLFQVAERSRGSVSGATEVFGRFGLALKGTGTSSEELLQVVETVQQAAAISGSSAETAKNAIIQLGQGLSSGQLRGEELNSVLEGMPRLAEAIADGMEIPFGNLRDAAKDGLLTAEDVFAAILNGGEAMQREFDTLKATTSQLGTVLSNEFTRAVSNLDKEVLGISAGIKDGLRLGIAAVKFFGENIALWAAVASSEFLILKLNIKYFAQDVFGFLTDLFTGEISPDDLIANITTGLDKAKSALLKGGGLVISFTIQKFDLLTDMLPNMAEAQRVIKGFTTFVEGLFKSLYKAVVGDSWWTGIFDPAHGEGGVAIGDTATWGVHLEAARRKLMRWKDNLVGLFAGLYKSSTDKWAELSKYFVDNELTIGTISTASIGAEFDNQIENLKEAWTKFVAWLVAPEQAMRPGGMVDVETTTGKAVRKLTKQYKDLTTQESQIMRPGFGLETVTVDSDLIRGFKDTFSAVTNTVKDNYDSVIKAIKSTPIVIAISSLAEDIAESFSGTKEAITQYFADNKDVLGLAISAGLGAAINSNLRAVLLKGAFIGLFIKAVSSLGDNAEFIEAIESQARGIGKLMADSLSGEGDLVTDLVVGLKNIGMAIGQGLLDGIFGEEFENSALVGLTGAIATALFAVTLSGKLRKAVLFVGIKLATAIWGSKVVTAFTSALAAGMDTSMYAAGANTKMVAAANALGGVIGKNVRKGIIVGFALIGREIVQSIGDKFNIGKVEVEYDHHGNELSKSNSLGKTLFTVFTDAMTGAIAGFTVGGPWGALAGAIGGALLGVFLDDKQKQGIINMFSGMKDAVLDSLTSAWTEFTSKITDLAPDWLKNLFGAKDGFTGGEGGGTADSSLLDNPYNFPQAPVEIEVKVINTGDRLTTVLSKMDSDNAIGAYASGGSVRGPGTGTSDDIPAMLSNGEFVMKASAVQKFGPAFMEAVNAGKVPQFRSEGGVAGTFRRLNSQLGEARTRDGTVYDQIALLNSIRDLKIATEAQTLALVEGNEEERAEATKAILDGIPDDPRRINPKDLAQSYADEFKSDFASALSTAFKTGDFGDMLKGIADSFTSRYIDAFVSGMTDSLFEDNKFFDKIFSGSIGFGSKTGDKVSEGIAKGTKKGVEGGAGEGGLMGMLNNTFSGLFKGIGDMFKGFGGGGAGGGLGGLLQMGLGFLGFSQGGVVPNTPGSQAGKDSVPAMLMPGEVVLSKNQLSNMNANGGGGQSTQSFNINVQGDVSRQTRQEIVKMMPQIAGGVNAQNKESNYRR